MDKTKEYIVRCAKSDEIQRLWKLRQGDFFTRSINDLIYCLGDKELDVINRPQGFRPMLHSTWIGSKIWLPRQDQLQEMVAKNTHRIMWYALIEKIYPAWTDNHFPVDKWSYEQLWLAFVMKEKYQKIWNGNEWIQGD